MTTEKCACDRTAPRISKIKGRTDDMIVVRGINVFPTQIEYALLQVEGMLPNYQIVVSRRDKGLDAIEVHVEIDEKTFSDQVKVLETPHCHMEVKSYTAQKTDTICILPSTKYFRTTQKKLLKKPWQRQGQSE